MNKSQDSDNTQMDLGTQQMGEFPSDGQGGRRRGGQGSARPVLLALVGLLLGLLLCGVGFGFGYAAGRVHGDALCYGGGRGSFNYPDSFYIPDLPPNVPDIPDIPNVDFIFVPGQGFGYACEGFPEPDVPGARAWLGVGVDDGDDGPTVGYVVEDSPAEAAGLEVDDIILELDGERTRDFEELAEVLADHDPCEEITLLIERDGDEEELEAVLGGILLTE